MSKPPAPPSGAGQASAAKKRRLAALEDSLAVAGRPAGKQRHLAQSEKRTGWPPGSQQAGKAARASSQGAATQAGSSAASAGPSQLAQAAATLHEAPYDPLDASLRRGPLAQVLQGKGSPDVVGHLLASLLAGQPGGSQAALGLRLQDRSLLLDNPAPAPAPRPQRCAPLRSLRPAGARQQRRLHACHLPPAQLTYAALQPLYAQWRLYVAALLAGAQSPEERLLTADYHGCHLTVVHSRLKALLGVEGIVARSTRHTFHVVTPADRVRVVAKALCTFQVPLDDTQVVTLFGKALAEANHPAAVRSGKR